MSDRSIDPVARVQALAPLIREHADANERQRHLSNEVAFELARNGLYRIAAPPRCGGEAVDPMTQIATIEAAARIDGSTAWNLMIGIESFGLIAPNFEHCAELLEDPLAILCGSTAAVGTADEIDGGFRINGRWQFVSGCHNSRVFAGLVQRRRGGEPIPHVPIVYAVVVRPDYKILDTWNVGGLCGSGSHESRSRTSMYPTSGYWRAWGSPARVTAGALSTREPARVQQGRRCAWNRPCRNRRVRRTRHRQNSSFHVDVAAATTVRATSLALAEVRLRAARALVFELVAEMWRNVCAGAKIDMHDRALFQIACSDAVSAAAEAVDSICEAAGTSANERANPLERLARDVRVVRQHITVAPQHIEDGGRVLLGLPPEGAMLKGLP